MAKENIDYKINIETRAADKGVENLTVSLEANEQQIGKTQKATDDLGKSMGGIKDGSDKAGKASAGLGTKLKALSMNPIVAILGVIIALFKSIESVIARNGKAAAGFDKVWSQIDGTLNALWQTLDPIIGGFFEKLDGFFTEPLQSIKDFGTSIKEYVTDKLSGLAIIWAGVKDIFTGNFEEGWEKVKEGGAEFAQDMNDIADEVANTYDSAVDSLKAFGSEFIKNKEIQIAASKELEANKTRIINLESEYKMALINSKLEQALLKQVREDETQSIEDRVIANDKIAETLAAQLEQEKALIAEKLHFNKLEKIRQGETDELRAEELSYKEQLADAEVRYNEIILEQQKFNRTLAKEKAENDAAALKAIDDEAKKLKETQAKTEADAKALFLLKQARREKEAAADDEEANGKLANILASTSAALGAIETIALAADADASAMQGIAAVQAGINTAQGVTAALGSAPPPLNFITAALVGAAGAIQIAAILKAKPPKRATGSSGGYSHKGGSSPTVTPVSVPDIPKYDEIYNDGIDLDKDTVKGQNNDKDSVRAFVVLSDIDDAKNTNDNINSNSSI